MKPRVGEVFVLTVAPGADVWLRVVAKREGAWCVVMTGATVFDVQPLTQHGWNRPMLGGWVSDASPLPSRGVTRVKPVEQQRVQHPKAWLAKRDAGRAVLPVMTWDGLISQARQQWRWDHERAAVKREEVRADAASLARFDAAVRSADASSGAAFPAWVGVVPDALIHDAEAAVRDARDATSLEQALHRLAAKHGHTFDDDELEDIAWVLRGARWSIGL